MLMVSLAAMILAVAVYIVWRARRKPKDKEKRRRFLVNQEGRLGDATIEFHYIRVLTEPLGSSALDDVYGILGVDALGQLKSYTFDYRTMRFSAKGE